MERISNIPFCKKHNKFKTPVENGFKCNECASKAVMEYRKRCKILLVRKFGGKCSKCGYKKCLDALTFHHLDPSQKDFNISGSSTKAFLKLENEAKKCILLCSNCHIEEHAVDTSFNFEDITFKLFSILPKRCLNCQKLSKLNKFCNKKCSILYNKKRTDKTFLSQISIKKIESLFKKHKSLETVGKILNYSGNSIKKRLINESALYQEFKKEEFKNKTQCKIKCLSCSRIIKSDQTKFCSINCRDIHQKINREKIINQIKLIRSLQTNITNIAKKMNLARSTVRYYIKKYNL